MLLWPVVGLAATVILENEGRPATTNADVNDDLYIAGNNVSVNHNVAEDLFGAANTVDIDADIGQDLHAIGNTVRVSGSVGDDLFAGGNTVRITVSTVDDVFAGGNLVEVMSDRIEGSVYAGGQKVNIKGNIKGSVRIGAETINIKSGTIIEGDLITTGSSEPNIEDGVQINGEKRHTAAGEKIAKKVDRNSILEWVTGVLIWFVVAVVLIYLFPVFVRDVVGTAFSKGGKSIGVGFAWIALLIPVVITLLIAIVGWPLAAMAALFTAGELLVAYSSSMVVLGVWTMKKFGKSGVKITWQHALLGVVIMRVVQLVPLIGGLLSIVVVLLTLGAVGLVLWERLRTEKVVVSEPAD